MAGYLNITHTPSPVILLTALKSVLTVQLVQIESKDKSALKMAADAFEREILEEERHVETKVTVDDAKAKTADVAKVEAKGMCCRSTLCTYMSLYCTWRV